MSASVTHDLLILLFILQLIVLSRCGHAAASPSASRPIVPRPLVHDYSARARRTIANTVATQQPHPPEGRPDQSYRTHNGRAGRVAKKPLTRAARLVRIPPVTITRSPTPPFTRWSATATLASMTRSRLSSAKPAVANSQLAVTLPSTGSEPLPPGSPKSCTPLLKASVLRRQPASSKCLKPLSEVGSRAPASIGAVSTLDSCTPSN